MSFNATKYVPKALTQNVVGVTARWLGGGAAANCTRLTGRGVTSVNYNSATGAYLITFDGVGEVFLGGSVTVMNTAGTTAGQKVVNSSAYSATNKTLAIFITDLATPTAQALATTEELWIDLKWADTDGPG